MRKKIIVSIIFLITFLALVQIPFNLEYFTLRKVEVSKNYILPEEVVIEKASWLVGQNIFGFDKKRLLKEMASFVQIEKIGIRRKYPDTLVIVLKEKSPWINLITLQKNYIINSKGYVLNDTYTNEIDTASLPVVRTPQIKLVSPYRVDSETIVIINDILLALESLFTPEQLQIDIHDPQNIEILADDILTVKIGDISQIEKKHYILKSLVSYIKNRWNDVDYIDISSIDNPVIKFKNGKKE